MLFNERRQRGVVARTASVLLVIALVALAAQIAWLAHFATTPLDLQPAQRNFDVAQGQSLREIAAGLERSGLVSSARGFVLLVQVLGRSGQIKAGSYEANGEISPLRLLDKLTQGQFAMGQIRFIEGWTFRQLRTVLDKHPALRHDTKNLTDREILERLGAPQTHPEGLFFPDTYHFAAGTSDLTILRQAYAKMSAVLSEAWERRERRLPFSTPYEALILASIVEKETGRPSEREVIAAVFINRLKKGMRLQTDPSVIYGLGERFDGNLRKRDLQTDQPYNTYTRYGLPPTPIALPGQASIQAALNPADSKVLYFVSRGDGTHHFSSTLSEHNRAVSEFQRLR